jgi:multidrug efflux pump subunit AcrA (membrane-fusion protein)
MDRLKVELNLPGPEARGLARGAAVVVSSPAFPGIRLDGKVERVAPVVDPASGTVRVVVAAANPEHALRPGVAATVEFPR